MSRLSPVLTLAACLRGETAVDADWDATVAAANRCWLTPQLYLSLTASQAISAAPSDIGAYLEFIHARNLDRNRRLRRQLQGAVRALNACGIAPTLLKGAIALIEADERLGGRLMSDIDILVRPHEAAGARAALSKLGYRQPEQGHDGYFTRPTDAGALELHRWPRPERFYASLAGIEAAPARLVSGGLRVRLPTGHFRVLHLVLHDQIKEGDDWRGCVDLRHLHDIAGIVSAGIDCQALRALPRTRRERDALEETLMLAARLFGAPVRPNPARTMVQTIRYRRRLAPLVHPMLAAPLRLAGDAAWILRRLSRNGIDWPRGRDVPHAFVRALRDPLPAYRGLIGVRTGPKS